MKNGKVANKKILLTFDYEVFFRKSGTFESCIQNPVNDLLTFFEKHRIGATFFVDVLYYLRLLEHEQTRTTAELFKSQLQRLVASGSRIEPHLHPHWLDATYVNGAWEFPHYQRYRLQSLSETEIFDLFLKSCRVLEEIAGEVQHNYKVMSYRAGGWCIQPFDQLKKSFMECGVMVDSSVAPCIKGTSSVHNFDFSHVKPINYYRFNMDPTKNEQYGDLVEIPISTFRCSSYSKIIRKIKNKIHKKELIPYGDGNGIPMSSVNRFLPAYEMVSLERMFPDDLLRIIQQSELDVVNIISHPKGLSKMSFHCLNQLVQSNHQFMTIKQYYEQEVLQVKVSGD
ncbi:hypothetical protein [Paenibacillus qinlingensis]|uniref:Polysaccharide deacetylase n=1 Tax=Paenibacillus qinlingensis TaxID=1837343 RepID=A0ABU1P2A4_9BACL|nr:hypothetical protein [Paenibacillus qinlingensis]MDR6553871.1 hypothetical protein [Paenibacillus qinlingensis]